MHEDFEVPQRLGKYQLRRLIARGGMGEVWLACKDGMEKPCVVKVLLPKYSRDPEYRRRFFREAKILSRLRHGRIVTILDFGECQGWLYIVMDYVDGVDLGRFCRTLRDHGQVVPGNVAGYIIGEVLEALRHAHERAPGGHPLGIIHRDITPGNVLISSEGEVFLTDFGLARHDTELSGEVFGTLEYMAPEQAEGAACFQSDLYGVGGLLHFMLTGRPPRKARNVTELMANLRPRLGALGRDDVAEPVLRLLEMCLEAELVDRIASAGDGILLLDSWPLYRKETTVTAKLYKRHVGPRRTGLTDIIPAATLLDPLSEHDAESVVGPLVVEGGTVRVMQGATVRVDPPPTLASGDASDPKPIPTVVLAPPVREPPAPGPVSQPPGPLWEPWWGDGNTSGSANTSGDASIEEGITTRFVPPRHPLPRSVPPPHLAEPDAPRLFRRRRMPAMSAADEAIAPVQTTERVPPPFDSGPVEPSPAHDADAQDPTPISEPLPSSTRERPHRSVDASGQPAPGAGVSAAKAWFVAGLLACIGVGVVVGVALSTRETRAGSQASDDTPRAARPSQAAVPSATAPGDALGETP